MSQRPPSFSFSLMTACWHHQTDAGPVAAHGLHLMIYKTTINSKKGQKKLSLQRCIIVSRQLPASRELKFTQQALYVATRLQQPVGST